MTTTETTIKCSNCGHEFPLTESLAAPLIEARVREAEEGIKAQAKAEAERAQADAAAAQAEEIAGLKAQAQAQAEKLKEAQDAQAAALRKQRELDEAKRELDLTVEKRVNEAAADMQKKAQAQAEETYKVQVTERDERIASMGRQIEELKKKAEQGSQQLQGEALELDLEETLRATFPMDAIESVAKGKSGADVLQKVMGPTGEACGAILWETKRTRNWTAGWIQKLKDDQREAGADVALLMSQALPKEVDAFSEVDGVWVAAPRYAVALAAALRGSLISLAAARRARDGQATKQEMVYAYLTGPGFKRRVEAILERFTAMQQDLAAEKAAMAKIWAKREGQINAVIESTGGMYGDLQAIAGQEIGEIEALDLPLLAAED